MRRFDLKSVCQTSSVLVTVEDPPGRNVSLEFISFVHVIAQQRPPIQFNTVAFYHNTCTHSTLAHPLTSMLVVFAKAPTGWMWSYRMMTPTITRRQKRTVSSSSNREEYSLPSNESKRRRNRFTQANRS